MELDPSSFETTKECEATAMLYFNGLFDQIVNILEDQTKTNLAISRAIKKIGIAKMGLMMISFGTIARHYQYNVFKYEKDIMSKDDDFFMHNKSNALFQGIDTDDLDLFRRLWKPSKSCRDSFDEDEKEIIWIYIHTIYLSIKRWIKLNN